MSVRVAVVTLSDTRTDADDEGGKLLDELLSAAGFSVTSRQIVREDTSSIQTALRLLLADDTVDAVVTTGGTGLAPRDNTLAALTPLFDREMVGFGEAFRRLSWEEVGARAMLSNATAGVAQGKIVAALPGSLKAVRLGVTALIAPMLAHAVDIAQGRSAHEKRQQKP
jgi:molybdopterin adenylyltransferase